MSRRKVDYNRRLLAVAVFLSVTTAEIVYFYDLKAPYSIAPVSPNKVSNDAPAPTPTSDTEVGPPLLASPADHDVGYSDPAKASAYDNAVASAAKMFRETRILYNKPKTLDFQKVSRIVLSVASASEVQAVSRVKSGNGKIQTAIVPVSTRVRASLDGPADLVTVQLENAPNRDKDVRDVTSTSNVTWVWDVTPRTLEPITLTLALTNVAKVDGQEVELEGPAYTDTFTVQASAWDRWNGWLKSFWAAVIALVTLLGGLIGLKPLLKWAHARRAKSIKRVRPKRQ